MKRRYIWFTVSYLFKFFSIFFTGMFVINMFVLFFMLIGRTKDLSIAEALDILKISSIVTTILIVLGVILSNSLKRDISRMMRFYPPIIKFHIKKALEE